MLGEDFRDQGRIVVREHAGAIAAAPRGFEDLDVVPVDAAAGTNHLEASAAVALNDLDVFRSNWEVHRGLPQRNFNCGRASEDPASLILA